MNILFDQGTPAPLRAVFTGHTVETAYERGWSSLANGDLLTAAEAASFDVFITTDQNLQNQQNLSGRRICRHRIANDTLAPDSAACRGCRCGSCRDSAR